MTTHTAPLSLTHPCFHTQLTLIGIGLIISSIIYFLASNWFGIPAFVRMGIPMGILLLSAIASVVVSNSKKYQPSILITNTLHTLCAIMAGLSLAVIGQIYQTGADAYQLFLYWSGLCLLWLYRHNTPVFILWCCLSQLALYLYVKQTFIGFESNIYILLVNGLLLLQWMLSNKFYPKSSIVLSVFIAILSIVSSALLWDNHQHNDLMYFLSMVLLPSLAIWHYYTHKKQGSLALLSLGIGIAIFMQLLNVFKIDVSFGSLFFYAFIALAMFFGIGYWLIKLFPKGSFHQIPIVFGSWIAGVLLAGAFLVFWESVSLFFGIVGFTGALIFLYKSQRLFVRQFSYSILLASQIAIIAQTDTMIDHSAFAWIRAESFILLIIQLMLMSVFLFVRPHWFVAGLQTLASYGFLRHFLIGSIYEFDNDFLKDDLFLFMLQAVMLLSLPLLFHYKYKLDSFIKNGSQAVLLFILGVISSTQLFAKNTFITMSEIDIPNDYFFSLFGLSDKMILTIVNIAFVGIIALSLLFKPHKKSELIALFVFGAILAMLGYVEIFVLLLGLLWTDINKLRLMRYAYLLAIGLFLWWLYYSLQVSFLQKSLTIFMSGIIFLIMSIILKKIIR